MKTSSLLPALLLLAACLLPHRALAQAYQQASSGTEIQADNLDPATYREWVDGKERALQPSDAQMLVPTWLLWTRSTNVGHGGLRYGESKTPGPRHLRIGFKAPVEVGSVLAVGGGTLSVLKADAAYPGDLGKDSDWLPAQRLDVAQLSRAEIGSQNYALWILPPGTQTRALRFSHVAAASDPGYSGFLGGAQILTRREMNLAPLSAVSTNAENQGAWRIINQSTDGGWETWGSTNRHETPPATQPVVSAENPALVTLTWPTPVKLSGLETIWTGFADADAQIYTGPADRHPRDAQESDWKTVGSAEGFTHGYPLRIFPLRIDFGEVVTTRAVRLKITKASAVAPYHATDFNKEGKRVWLGELMALSPLGDSPLKTVSLGVATPTAHPPIPIRFKLARAGFVTLVIEKPDGQRVRNLVSETPFPAGDNVAWWDGTDDLGRDIDAAQHGIYKIPAQFVAPGTYRARGLVHDAIVPRLEFSIYSPGSPPWETADKTGGWTTNHTPPQSALFVPAERAPGAKPLIFLGSFVSEGGAGLAWVDQNGVKQGGRGWVGGNWTAAPFLAADNGAEALPGVYAYVASAWRTADDEKKGQLRLTSLSAKGDGEVAKWEFDPVFPADIGGEIGGVAAHNGLLAVSFPRQNQLVFVRAKSDENGKVSGDVVGKAPLEDGRGLVFDADGKLLVLAGKKLLRFSVTDSTKLSAPETVVEGLEDPRGITLSSNGNIYISDWGQSHQVKGFTAAGKLFRTLGKAGAPQAGPYDPNHMNHPQGLAIDENNRLWVTENDYLPKRVSVWNTDGTLWKAFYGPAKYGGGGTLDPKDKTRFLYADEKRGTLEFKLDWDKGESRLVNVLMRNEPGEADGLPYSAAPELPLSYQGRKFYANNFNSSPTTGPSTVFLFADKGGTLAPVVGMGYAFRWDLLKTAPFKALWPEGVDLDRHPYQNGGQTMALFLWTDANGDAQAQPDEVTYRKASDVAGIAVMPDLSFALARVGDKAMRFLPNGLSKDGVPRYDIAGGEVIINDVKGAVSDGGNQLLTTGKAGWSVVGQGIEPFSPYSLSGAKNDGSRWSYPTLWPGLHPSHEAPTPGQPGEVLGSTRVMGDFLRPKGSQVEPLWAINSNMGSPYLFTADGLFVATLFQDFRLGQSWTMPAALRNTDLSRMSLGAENFWPTITQTQDGEVYMTTGHGLSLARLDGLDTLRPIAAQEIKVGADDLKAAQTYILAEEAARQQAQGSGVLKVALQKAAPVVDGKLDEWGAADWAEIDKSGVAAFFNSNTKPYDVNGALAMSGDRLFAAYKTGDANLLKNSGEIDNAPFKTGGALDLMLATNPNAGPKRTAPVEGDLRLIVTRVKDKTKAVLYRAVVAGATEKVPFSSPWRTISFDEVKDVSDQVQLAGEGGNYEFSIPLTTLGLAPKAGQSLGGDIGVLRGNGFQTTARVYWSNKATGIVSDVPSEAMLAPQLWGRFEFTG